MGKRLLSVQPRVLPGSPQPVAQIPLCGVSQLPSAERAPMGEDEASELALFAAPGHAQILSRQQKVPCTNHATYLILDTSPGESLLRGHRVEEGIDRFQQSCHRAM